jgi:hypothetical protein
MQEGAESRGLMKEGAGSRGSVLEGVLRKLAGIRRHLGVAAAGAAAGCRMQPGGLRGGQRRRNKGFQRGGLRGH